MNLPLQSIVFAPAGGESVATAAIVLPSIRTVAFGTTFSSAGLMTVPLTSAIFSARAVARNAKARRSEAVSFTWRRFLDFARNDKLCGSGGGEFALGLDPQRLSDFTTPITNANLRRDRPALTLRKLDRLRLQNKHSCAAEHFFAYPAVAMRLDLDDKSRRHKRVGSLA